MLPRLIGYHLGIRDEFGACNSLEDAEAMFDEYMIWTPQRLRSCRESTHILQAWARAASLPEGSAAGRRSVP